MVGIKLGVKVNLGLGLKLGIGIVLVRVRAMVWKIKRMEISIQELTI